MAKITLSAFVVALLLVSVAAFAAGAAPAHKKLVRQAETLVHQLAHGQYKAAGSDFDDKMKQSLPPEKLGKVWRQLTATVGPFQKTGVTKTAKYNGYTVVLVQTQFKKRTLWARVAFDKSAKIAGLYF
ncbi:MAG TPA: DUF3887 domain-containing protein [Gammaproteobacteria bacterium]|nr:DUF3887 domain-containing protein [Gammaproteobacteria bacterium]